MGLIQLFLEQPENKQKILRLKAQGMPDKRIAAEVGLSENAVGQYFSTVCADLGLKIKKDYSVLQKLIAQVDEHLGLKNKVALSVSTVTPEPNPMSYSQYVEQSINKSNEYRKTHWDDLNKIRSSGLVTQFLQQYYKDLPNLLIVKRNSAQPFIYPCVFLVNPDTNCALDGVQSNMVMDLTGKSQKTQLDFEYRFFRVAKQPDLLEFNKVTFALRLAEVSNGELKIDIYPSDYLSGLDTSESLSWELMKAIYEFQNANPSASKTEVIANVENQLPLRKRIEDLTKKDFFNGIGRAATFGVAMLFIYRGSDGNYWFTANVRSGEVAVQANSVHTLPAGMFQTEFPLAGLNLEAQAEEWGIEKRIICEWLEEVYGHKEYRDKATRKPYAEIQQDEATVMPVLVELLKQKKAELLCSGIAIDLINLRPEICTVLIVHEYNEQIVSRMRASKESEGKKIEYFLLEDIEKQKPNVMQYLAPENMVASGAAAIWQGLKIALPKLYPIKVNASLKNLP